ncbi:hypothetical protein EPUS_06206 [Endocarpon pusillum Z07020]|uniref:Mid2 domain-containing protein n=1 Tax=Endocarpon pusillum (strain Z07020 / HMAS-L-300199) TaxID=1263415 RepID=U1GT51_ENDPU|nr:uncharacterized protein EPUS_06206 [Endocarpon pusillum Z07020]ERF75166.1 hypothetical protein EPUS_06206 [Endocarpon pusillum Z07020]
MHMYLPYFASLLLVIVPGALGQQSVDPISNLVSQALSVATDVVSLLSVQATATASPTSTSTPTTTSTSSTSSRSSSASQSSVTTTSTTSSTTSSQITTSTQSASDTAAAAAASSSAASAIAATNAQNSKNRTIAIALGVVLGLLALAILTGLLLFCLRRRRRQRAQGSRRSFSSEDVGGATWGKEPLSNSSTVEHNSPNRLSTHEHNHTPIHAGAPRMTENALHRHGGNSALGNDRPVPRRGAPDFQPGITGGAPAVQGAHHSSQSHIPLSSHSPSGAAAAGFGGAALGALAANHHHDSHEDRGFGQHHNDDRGISRKTVGAAFAHGTSDHSPRMGMGKDAAPGYQAGHSISPQGKMANSSQPVRTTDSTSPSSAISNGNPPAYNGTDPNGVSHALSSHPPFADTHRHSTGHDAAVTGAAGVGAGALAGAALANHHNGDQDHPGSSLTGRRSWDHNRQPRHPQSILANPANRRSFGSTNPYVQPRDPRRARFSDDVVDGESAAHDGNGRYQDDLPQNSPYPKMEQTHSPQQSISSEAWDHATNGSPNANHMPGGWRGSGDFTRGNGSGEFNRPISNRTSGEFNRPGNRPSYGNDASIPPVPNMPTSPPTDSKPKNPSLSDLHQQEQEGWYRGRYMGDDVRPVDSANSGGTGGYDDRFYAVNRRSVGQAI